ncbi:MAG: competence protein ComEC [Methylophagaceae bacterium]|jgi:competence protein ComEC
MIKTAISFMLGCLLFLQLPSLPHSFWLWVMIVSAVILLIFAKTRLLAYVLLGGLWALMQANNVLNDRLLPKLDGNDLMITGIIANVPKDNGKSIRFEFKPDKMTDIILPRKILLNWYKPLPLAFSAGERWQLMVRLKQIHGMANPASFDYEAWLFQQRIDATGYVRNDEDNRRLAAAAFYSINSLRQTLLAKLSSHLQDSPQLGLIQGLTTGIRDNISLPQWQTLRLSGTNHLLAISGLHIGLSAAIGFFSMRWLWSRRAKNLLILPAMEAAAIAGFFAALFYAGLAGFAIPTQRALIMVATVMTALLIRRPVAPSYVLAFSLLLVLIWDPFAVLSAGFWLSFSAVAIILFTSQNRFPSPRWQWLKIHTLIAFGLTPLLLLFFMQTSLIAPIANIIAVPFISLIIVPILLLASLMLWLFEPIGSALLQLADSLLTLFWPLLDYLAALPFSHLTVAHLPFYYYLAVVVGTLLVISPRGFPAKWLGIIGLSPLLLFHSDRPQQGEFWFTLLDVGQGLAAVVQTRDHTLVFDAGPKYSDSFNTGTAVVLPFLQQQGIKHIDTLVISHADNDHIGGARPLMRNIAVDALFTSVPNKKLPDASPCFAGQSWQWNQISFSMLYPGEEDNGSENNLSCVLKVSNAAGSVLLTGDIESQAEEKLILRHGNNLHATILVAPHHGSKTSSSTNFIDTVQPEVVLFPVGYHNRYHFPAEMIIQRYQHRHISQYNSASHGAIQFKMGIEAMSVPRLYRQQTKSIWSADNTD